MNTPSQSIKNHKSNDLAKELFKMTWPMLIGVISLMSFLLADSIFISRLGVEPLAIIGFTTPIYLLVIGFQVGLGVACTALISQQLGAGNDSNAGTLGGAIFGVSGSIIATLCLFIWFAREFILGALGGTKDLLPLIDGYWLVWLPSAFLGAVVYFGYSICRAHGNTKLPGATMVFTSLANIALDPVFIFYFDLGLNGAAYATLCSFLMGACLVFPTLFKNQWLNFKAFFNSISTSINSISKIAVPAVMSQMLPSLAAMIATAIVAQYGTEAVAAWGLGARLEFFSIVMILALTMSIPPMVGRRYGAKQFEQISQLSLLAFKFMLVWQCFIALIGFVFAGPFSQMLTSDESVIQIVEFYLVAVPISYGPLGVCMIVVSICNAINAPFRALAISFMRLFACYLPLVWVGSLIGNMQGLIIGAAIGNLLAGIMAWRGYRSAMAIATRV